MSEKNFRIILGAWLIIGLFINSPYVIYALVALLLFEGVTNLRVPGLVTSARFGKQTNVQNEADNFNPNARTSFEAERGLRLIVAILIVVPMISAIELLWLLPWFVGFALIGAGLSGICPMVLALRWLGMR
jgi:hypothetical protein